MSQEDQFVEPRDRVIIMIDPFSRQAHVYNYTKAKRIKVDGLVDIQPNDKSEVTVSINATFTLEGMVCEFKKSPESEGSE